MYGSAFNPELTLKALCFFGDGNLETVPKEHPGPLVTAVKSVDVITCQMFMESRTPTKGPNSNETVAFDPGNRVLWCAGSYGLKSRDKQLP